MMQVVKQQILFQFNRYSSTKYGKIFSIFIYFAIFTFVPYLVKLMVPFFAEYLSLKYVYIVVSVIIVGGTTLVFNLSMYFIYVNKIPFFEQYRSNPQKPWPWEQNKQQWLKLLKRSIKITANRIFIVVPILQLIQVNIKFQINMNINEPPSISQMLPYFILFQIFEDIFFFCSHRALHSPYLYKFHKIHHQYTTTVSIAGVHSHIVEFIFSNTLTIGIYFKIVQVLLGPVHINIIASWTMLRMIDAYAGHSGYKFSWTPMQLLPFACYDDYHDFHHSRNSGNFGGQFRFLDSCFGYSKLFWEFKEKVEKQSQLKQVKNKQN